MKFLFLLMFLVGCGTTSTRSRPHQSHKERISNRIENCILRLADSGIDEKLVYSYCSKTHRPVKNSYFIEKRK